MKYAESQKGMVDRKSSFIFISICSYDIRTKWGKNAMGTMKFFVVDVHFFCLWQMSDKTLYILFQESSPYYNIVVA